MTYRFWHPIAVCGFAGILGTWIPAPWAQILAVASSLVLLGFTLALLRHASRLVDEGQAIRDDAIALKERVDAYADQVVGIVERRDPPRPH